MRGYADVLREGDKTEFTKLLDRAAQARRSIPAKWVPATEDLLEVRIPLTIVLASLPSHYLQASWFARAVYRIDHITSSSAVLD